MNTVNKFDNNPLPPNVNNSKIITNYFQKEPEGIGSFSNDNTLVSIPLQYNNPNKESLRSQQILITPYNCIRY